MEIERASAQPSGATRKPFFPIRQAGRIVGYRGVARHGKEHRGPRKILAGPGCRA